MIATATIASAIGSRFTIAADVSSQYSNLFGLNNWSNLLNWQNTPDVKLIPNNGNGGFTYDVKNVNGAKLDMDVTVERAVINLVYGPYSLTANVSADVGGLSTGAVVNVPAGGELLFSGYITNSTINHFGSGTFSTSVTFSGTGSACNIMPGATLEISGTSPSIFASNDATGLVNHGVINLSSNLLAEGISNAPGGTIRGQKDLTVWSTFQSDGVLDVRSLLLNDIDGRGVRLSGTITIGGTNGGGFLATASGVTRFSNATFNSIQAASIRGETHFSSTTVNAPLNISGSDFGTTVSIDGPTTFNSTVNLTAPAPTLTGSAAGTFANLIWNTGTISGNVTIPAGGALHLPLGTKHLGAGTIEVGGTAFVEAI